MRLKRFSAIFMARNKEFFRDRSAFGWNFLFPFLIILGFALMFQRGAQTPYNVGLIPPEGSPAPCTAVPDKITGIGIFKTVFPESRAHGFDKLKHHRLDLLIQCGSQPTAYWINDSSPKGRIAESLLLKALSDPEVIARTAVRGTVQGRQIDYIDWLFPGILAMNSMFSALYGVGWVVVRYRKTGVLKRFKATPLTAFEYLSAQVISRLFVLLVTNIIVYTGCAMLFGFKCEGSYVLLILIFSLGCVSLISLGLIVAARSSSEEFANGVLNFIAWPMMFLSEVWFPLESTPQWVQTLSQFLPLTHVTEGMRKVMNDGTGIGELGYHFAVLGIATMVFMAVGSALFKWTDEA